MYLYTYQVFTLHGAFIDSGNHFITKFTMKTHHKPQWLFFMVYFIRIEREMMSAYYIIIIILYNVYTQMKKLV